MSIRSRLFARFYDRSMEATEQAGLASMRASLLADVGGDVVEIGAGTGLNLPRYRSGVRSLSLVEPDPSMVRRLRPLVDASPVDATIHDAPAEDLPFEAGSVDAVVSTLVLCGVDDLDRALAEVRRVLRPDGRVLLIEHVRSTDAQIARRQDRIDWLQRLSAGCHCNRDTAAALVRAGFDTSGLVGGVLPHAPSWVRPLIVGTATVSGGSRPLSARDAPETGLGGSG